MRRIVGFACVLSACVTATPTRSKLTQQVAKPKMSSDEIRIRVRSLAARLSGQLEELADDVIRSAPEPRVRFEMTRLKINAIPALQSALFEPDPMAALIDAWVLLVQLERGAATVLGSSVYARVRASAGERVRDIRKEIEGTVSAVAGPDKLASARPQIHEWARTHPLTDTFASRESTAPLFAHLTAESGISLGGSVADALQQMRDLQSWLSLQAAYLPKQARWQAEFMVVEAASDPALAGAASKVGAYVDQERRAAMSALGRERIGAQGFISGERAIVLRDIDQMGYGWIDHGFDRATQLMDRLFLRFLLLLAVVLAGGIMILQIVLSPRRHKPLEPRRT